MSTPTNVVALNPATATMAQPQGQPQGAVLEQAKSVPTGTRAAKKEQDAAKRAANKEQLDAAKKVDAALTPATPPKKSPAKKSPAKATSTSKPTTSAKATTKVLDSAGVAAAVQERKDAKPSTPKPAPASKELPTPAKLEWTENKEDGGSDTSDAKYTFKVREGSSGGWFASLRTTKGGRWVTIAGKAPSQDDAKQLAGWASAGAMWLTYSKLQGVPFATVVANHTAAKASK